MKRATKLQKETTKEIYLLLKKTYNTQEIAEMLQISERTLYEWAEQGKWDTLISERDNSKQIQLDFIYAQLKQIRDENKDKIMTSVHADIIVKLTKASSELENKTSIPNTLAVLQEMAIYTATNQGENLNLIKSIIGEFVAYKIKVSMNKK